MSSITEILATAEMADSEKLQRIAEVVAKARDSYGNTEAEITAHMVPTTHGDMNFNYLDDSSKIAILKAEVQRIKAIAVEFSEQCEGVNLNRKIEELIATNSFLVNVSAGTKFEYL